MVRRRVSLAVVLLALPVTVGALAIRHPGMPASIVASWRLIHTPGAGLDVAIPRAVFNAGEELRRQRVTEFRMAPRVLHDLEYAHRLLESTWPIRVVDEAEVTVGFVDEIRADPRCATIWFDQELALGRCHT